MRLILRWVQFPW
ncbi:hypothetical protein CAEBREN_06200 [Caenorhabditis brenneri]|uniref:Uncharacterized protein n=1 Tax=Caenorhabditis brenneri TaxID=135651 RepID=G0N5S6_CAEBE|nr:hypothetical protein CAEBREN_06200 [Caenorhabditis brenneri]